MKKIIHLSDLHTGHENLSTHFRQIVTNIAFLKEPASKYIVLISGDLVEDGTRDGSYEDVSAQLGRLEAVGFKTLVIPGNHDLGTGSNGFKELLPKFNAHFFGNPDLEYPKVDVIDKVAFIGLNSMADELNWYDRLFAQGELGGDQLKRLDKILKSKSIKEAKRRVVYLHHHPFEPRPFHGLRDSKKLGKVLKGRSVNALLYGHNHDGHISHGTWKIERVYDAGSSTNKDAKPFPHRVIDLSQPPAADYDGKFLRGL